MLSGYTNFLKRMNAGGTNFRRESIENSLHLLDMTFADDPSYCEDGVSIWYSERVIHPRIYNCKWKSTTPSQASIQTLLNEEFYVGDILHWNEENGYWICVGVDNLHGLHWEGTLQYCNFWLKFKSPLDDSIREYPISMWNATQYGTGEDVKKMITVGSSAHIIYLPCDKHTVLLDNGKRFLIDKNKILPTAYKLTQMDTTSVAAENEKNGILRLYVLEDQFNPKTDDAENMIADYYEDEVASGKDLETDENLWL